MLKLSDFIPINFNLQENSKNDAIPEISRIKDHLCVFVFGPPASGKSTFINDFILRINNKFTIINPDDIDYLRRGKSYDTAKPFGTTKLSILKMSNILKNSNGENLIYDTTGNDYTRIKHLSKIARDNDYQIIFIHIIDSLKNILSKAQSRTRPTDSEYIKTSYSKSQKLINTFSNELSPDNYYIITTINNEYKFYKYNNNKLYKKSGSDYLPLRKQ